MKNFKRFISIILVAVLLCAALTACGSVEKTYSVTVKDALGNPYTSGIVVKFMQGDTQVAMQPCDKNGTAAKSLPSGKYTAMLTFADTDTEYYYDNNIKLTSRKSEVEVVVTYKINSEPETLTVGAETIDTYNVNSGCTYVDLKTNSRNYFLFTPTEAGNYEFSIPEGDDAVIGYYGTPHFVQENSAAEVVDNKFTINVRAAMIGTNGTGTTTVVIGIDAGKKTKNCVLGINRLGDPIKTVEDEPWTIYQKTVELQDYKLPAGAELKEFDLKASTDTYNLVFNENDGYYHLDSANGPLVLVRLGENCEYIDCFKTILDRSGVTKYFYDEDGNFVKKESYSECLLEYIEYIDEDYGVYPLTEDLKYIIQQRGDYYGWWDIESNGYIFKDSNGNNDSTINTEIAWLLMCCYIG